MTYVDHRFSTDASSHLTQALGGSGGASGVLSDNNDASYIDWAPPPGIAYVDMYVIPFTIGADQRIAQVMTSVRYKTVGGATDFYTMVESSVTTNSALYDHWADDFGTTINWRDATWRQVNPDGNPWKPSDIGRMRLQDNGGGPGRPHVTEALVRIDLRTRATVTVTAPSGTPTVKNPTVTWVYSDSANNQEQKSFWIKIFTDAVVTTSGFNPDLSPATYDSASQPGVDSDGTPPIIGAPRTPIEAFQIATNLPDDSYHVYVKSSKDFNGADWWSEWASLNFVIDSTPPLPTDITPVEGATVITDIPVVSATLLPCNIPSLVKTEYELSKDNTFATGVVDLLDPDSFFEVSGPTSNQVEPYDPLSPGTWYIRAREINKEGLASKAGWTAPQSFTVVHLPTATDLAPDGGDQVPWAASGNVTFSWTFTDSSPTEFQSAYQIVVERISDGHVVLDTGKISSQSNQGRYAIGGAYKNTPLQWHVRLYDHEDEVGPWSSWALFSVDDIPLCTIISPPDTAVLDTASPLVTWAFMGAGGATQTSYQVIVKDHTGATVGDSGVIAGTDQTFQVPGWLAAADTFTITLNVTGTGGTTGTSTVTVTRDTAAPPSGFTVDVSEFDTVYKGFARVNWSFTAAAGFVSWRIYRRLSGAGVNGWVQIGETFDPEATEWHDYYAPSSNLVDYAVTQVTATSETAKTPLTVEPVSEYFWLIHPTDPTQNIRLHSVTQDNPTEAFESKSFQMPGRGVHVEYGSRWGWSSTLKAQIRDNGYQTARQQREVLRALKNQLLVIYVRSPFGDVWQCALGDIAISHLGGVGTREFCDLTIPVTEVSS